MIGVVAGWEETDKFGLTLHTQYKAQANSDNIINNQWSLWMTGEADIESTWDSYVQSVNDAGLPQVLEIRQKAFDEYLANN